MDTFIHEPLAALDSSAELLAQQLISLVGHLFYQISRRFKLFLVDHTIVPFIDALVFYVRVQSLVDGLADVFLEVNLSMWWSHSHWDSRRLDCLYSWALDFHLMLIDQIDEYLSIFNCKFLNLANFWSVIIYNHWIGYISSVSSNFTPFKESIGMLKLFPIHQFFCRVLLLWAYEKLKMRSVLVPFGTRCCFKCVQAVILKFWV